MLTDLDGDGDIDVIGLNDQGYAFRINDGSKWDLNSFNGQIDLLNSTIVDFDSDGDLDLMNPNPGLSDGNSSTVEGSISLRTINSTNISGVSTSITTLVYPYLYYDNGLRWRWNVLEHVVSAGESNSRSIHRRLAHYRVRC